VEARCELAKAARRLAGRAEFALRSGAACYGGAFVPLIHDTIAALSTPVGTSALAVLRVSGSEVPRLANEIFGKLPPPREMHRGEYRDGGGVVLDDVMFVVFRGPKSYTGEDTLEISCHGNPLIVRRILDDLIARGCRLAAPGEFTQRAFLGGRMDLSQAEAVMDVIHARSERALEAANRQLRGALGRRTAAAVDRLLGVVARVEAYIDFPEEDLPAEDQAMVEDGIRSIAADAAKLRATKHYGDVLRGGLRTVIVGKPNAGKSSLLNRLVGYERAIVSPEPGTTRDFIEEQIMIGPHSVRLIDTAGLNPSPTLLEGFGIEKTRERIEDADLVLLVVDATQADGYTVDGNVISGDAPTLLVKNKVDLLTGTNDRGAGEQRPGNEVRVSAKTGEGLSELVTAIAGFADRLQTDIGEETIAINARHAAALAEVERCAAAALEKLKTGEPMELLASDLRGALHAWEEISGKIDNERMLDQLFATFCIGK
jgi:tRNA modification GTPase TrmE